MFQVCAPHWNIHNSFPSFQLQQHRQSIIVLAFIACLDKIIKMYLVLSHNSTWLSNNTNTTVYLPINAYLQSYSRAYFLGSPVQPTANPSATYALSVRVCSIRVCGTEPKKLAVVGPCTMHDCSVVGLQL